MKLKSVVFGVLCLGALILVTNCSNPNKEDYIDACAKGDFETAHKILDKLHSEYLETWSEDYGSSKRSRERKENSILESREKYYKCFHYVYKNEIQLIVVDLGGKEANDKVAFLLDAIPVIGYIDETVRYIGGYPTEVEEHKVWRTQYDRLCDVVLNLAINRRNKELAQTALLHYKEDSKKDAAKQKYEEAVALGMFE